MQSFYPESSSVVRSEMIVQWKKERNIYNFEKLPDTAVICVDYAILKHLNTFGAQKIKGIKGKYFVKNQLLFCSEFDNGAPGIINLLEELRALKVETFIFLGSAGVLSSEITETSMFFVKAAISGNGITAFYSDQQIHYPADDFSKITDFPELKDCICYSTDAPYRETRPLLNEVAKMGAQLVDMECAAVYAFAEFYSLKASCFLIAADNLCQTWVAPKDFKRIIAVQKMFVDKLIYNFG